jgi:ketosteroid isomerase-like protein
MTRAALDRAAIHDLVDRWSDAVNHAEWDALEALSTQDLTWERLPPSPFTLQGREAVLGFLRGNDSTLDVLLFSVAALSIDIQGPERATARSTMSERVRFKDTGAALHVVASYFDQFTRTRDGWRFSRRTVKSPPGKMFRRRRASPLTSQPRAERPARAKTRSPFPSLCRPPIRLSVE